MQKLLFLLAFLAITTYTQAYDWDPSVYQVGKKYPGYIITNSGDTLHGFIEARNRCGFTSVGKSNQNYCEFYKNENDKKPTGKYKPTDIKGYSLANKVYHSIAYSGGLSAKALNFNLLITDGQISQYHWFRAQEGAATARKNTEESWEEFDARRYSTSLILQKGDERPRESTYYLLNFAKKVSELVAEHEDLAESVKNKDKGYGMLKFDAIIEEYNLWYAENNPK